MNKPTDSAGAAVVDVRSGKPLEQVFRDTYRAFSKKLSNQIGRFEITLGQWYFLRILWEQDGLSQRELSARVGLVEPTTAAAVSRMEKSGLVERRVEAEDRRRRLVYLTPEGQALRAQLLPIAEEINQIASKDLDRESAGRVRLLLKRMKSNLDNDETA